MREVISMRQQGSEGGLLWTGIINNDFEAFWNMVDGVRNDLYCPRWIPKRQQSDIVQEDNASLTLIVQVRNS